MHEVSGDVCEGWEADKVDGVRKRPIPSIERLIMATQSVPFDASGRGRLSATE